MRTDSAIRRANPDKIVSTRGNTFGRRADPTTAISMAYNNFRATTVEDGLDGGSQLAELFVVEIRDVKRVHG